MGLNVDTWSQKVFHNPIRFQRRGLTEIFTLGITMRAGLFVMFDGLWMFYDYLLPCDIDNWHCHDRFRTHPF